jgi:DNA end-binding protein Ku
VAARGAGDPYRLCRRSARGRRPERAIVSRMPPHSLGSGTISFGLVSIPVKLYTAAVSGNVAFNMLHAKCGSRIKQQQICPQCNEVVERSALVKGYEFTRDQYVRVTDDELRALEGEASKTIDIEEFVPLDKVDPIYFEKTYYLGPDKGGEKPYRLLTDTMTKSGRVALATFVMRGKESLVLLRAAQDGLMLHTMYFADEIRSFADVDKGGSARIRDTEIELAQQLIDGLSADDFKPERYQDQYRQRVLDFLNEKVEGRTAAPTGPQAKRAQVVDLMEALKASLGKRPAAAVAADKKPLAKAKSPAAAPAKRAQGGKK